MRALYRACSGVVTSAALTFACGGSGNPVGPTSLVGAPPVADAAPALDLSGSWRGTFSQSRDTPGYSPGGRRTGTMRLSLTQSGSQISGTGEADGTNGCLPSPFVVAGRVSGTSFSVSLTSSSGAGGTAYASGIVVGGELDVTLSSLRAGCRDWNGSSSLNRQP